VTILKAQFQWRTSVVWLTFPLPLSRHLQVFVSLIISFISSLHFFIDAKKIAVARSPPSISLVGFCLKSSDARVSASGVVGGT
jgi:hypothetical protein